MPYDQREYLAAWARRSEQRGFSQLQGPSSTSPTDESSGQGITKVSGVLTRYETIRYASTISTAVVNSELANGT